MAKKRDYKTEYARRIARGKKRGFSRSQARGHARSGQAGLRPIEPRDIERLEAAFKSMRALGSQSAAAKANKVAPERLRRFIRQNDLAKLSGRSWQFTDNRPREMRVISRGEAKQIKLAGYDHASLNGRHLAAVKAFLSSNDIELLKPFEGEEVNDAKGKSHPLETNPNILHRLASAGTEVFHEIYRLIV